MRRNAASLAFAALLCACGSDKVATGPSGTETGSAVQARLRMPDGHVAAGARVAVRPKGSQETSAGTVLGTADDSGVARFRLGQGDWTMEARLAGVAVRRAFRIGLGDTNGVIELPVDTLKIMAALALCVDRADPKTEFVLDGLGRRSWTGSDGCVRWDSLPSGAQVVRSSDSVRNWQVGLEPGKSDSFFQVEGRPEAWFRAGRSIAWSGPIGVPLLVDLPLDTRDTAPEEWMGPDERDIPAIAVWPHASSGVRAWMLPMQPGNWKSRRRMHGPGSVVHPFGSDTTIGFWSVSAMAAASVALDSLTDLAGYGSVLKLESPLVPGYDSAQGWYVESRSDRPLAIIDSMRWSSKGDFSFLVHAALVSGASVSLLDWSESDASSGIRLDLVSSGLRLVAPGIDTSIAILQTSRFHAIALAFDGNRLRVGLDGRVRLTLTPDLSGRPAWRQPRMGVGAGVRITQILTARIAMDPGALSSPPVALGR